MHRYQLIIEYVGTGFKGWQIQRKNITVQGTIQKTISKVIHEKIKLYGSGRTDTNVHATAQSAHFDTINEIKKLKKFLNSLNYFLNKKNISILSVKKKPLCFHARFLAKKRIYKYIIYNRDSLPSINRNRGWHVKKKLDLGLIKKASRILEGTHDYSTFRASNCSAVSAIKKIDYVKVTKKGTEIKIIFQSKSFLKQQVRSMVGSLKYVGEKKWPISRFKKIFKSKKRILCAPPAPGDGLYLEKVIY
tara:strand:- start:9379 stop:10119 length:741 start_codon:yes stop_codon:yes gene_type:complete